MFNNQILDKFKQLCNGGELPPLLLCVSGGLDSMVMLDIFRNINLDLNFKIFVSHINYQIHDLSNEAEELVKKYCTNFNIEFQIDKVKINNKSNFEAEARKIRYEIFDRLLVENQIKFICTAHHFDDQLETLYMKYKQNAPITSFRGILEIDGSKWRPLLDFKKSDIKKYAIKNNLNWVDDSTNLDMSYLRNSVRQDEIPNIKKENPRLNDELFQKKREADKLFKEASEIKQSYIEKSKIRRFNNPKYFEILKSDFSNLESNIKKIIIQSFLNEFQINLQSMTNLHWKTFWQFLDNDNIGKEFTFSSCIKFQNSSNKYIIYNPKSLKLQKFELKDGLKWYNSKFKFIDDNISLEEDEGTFILKKSDFINKIFVRNWKAGDKIQNNEDKSFTKISRIFNKNKFSKIDKTLHPIIVDKEDNPVLIPKLRHNSCNNNINEKIMVKWQQN